MTDPAPSTRQRILEAVITCIENDGLNNLTTRRIAEVAGTNIASINYHFRTKDLLVEEALAMTLKHMLGDLSELSDPGGLPFPQALEQVLVYMIEGSQHFPGIIQAHFHPIMAERRKDTPVAQTLHQAYELLARRAIQEYPAVPPDQVRLALFQVFSSAFFNMLAPGLLPPDIPVDPASQEAAAFLARYQTRVFLQILSLEVES